MARPKKSLLDKIREAFPNLDVDNIPSPLTQTKYQHPDDPTIEAESALLYFNLKGAGFTKQVCPCCNREFAYKYTVKLGTGLCCSDLCRQRELEKIGIEWDPVKPPEEKWGFRSFGPLPAFVPPDVLNHLDEKIKRDEDEVP